MPQKTHTDGDTYVVIARLHSGKLPNDKFNSRLQVLINKIGGLCLWIAACLQRRGEEEVRRHKSKRVLLLLLKHLGFLLCFNMFIPRYQAC